MDHPLQDPRDFFSAWVGGVDLTAQFPFTRRVGGEGGTDKVIQSRHIKNAMNGACSLLNPMGSFQFSSIVSEQLTTPTGTYCFPCFCDYSCGHILLSLFLFSLPTVL